MDKAIVEQINRTQRKVFIAVAGGGQNFIGDYLTYDGGSNTILGFYVPYKQELFNEFICGKPDSYASEEAARKLAVASYKKARILVGEDAIGIGAASSVASASEREGRIHKLCVAIQTKTRTKAICYYLKQGRTRAEENQIVSEIILHLLAEACGVEPNSINITLKDGEKVVNVDNEANYQVVELVHGERKLVCVDDIYKKDKIVIYGGSFNPYHNAHKIICELAESVTGEKPYVEISVNNTDKPFLDYVEISKRVKDINSYGQKVLLTNAARYVDKIKILPQKTEKIFVVGADTWERIWDSKYGVSINELFDTFSNENVKFLVFSRDGKTIECIKNKVNAANLNMFNWIMTYLVVPSKEALDFNISMNSTAIRQSQNN